MKNKIIIIGGYCATGKSTFARTLSRELNIPCFEKDIIKETLGDGFGPESGEVFKKGSFVTFMLMLHIAECFLQAGRACILESNFRVQEFDRIKELLEKYNGECLLFKFKGDLDVIHKRYLERHEAGERHWVHKGGGTIETFKNAMTERFGLNGVEAERTVDVDATSFDDIDYENLVGIAKGFIK